MTITIAIILAVLGSAGFALGATVQHQAVGHTVDADDNASRVLGFARLWSLLRRPRWLGGLGLILLGATLHIVALNLAPLTVVQPVGILAVPFSVLLAARIKRQRPTMRIWLSVVVAVVGIVWFTILSARHAVAEPVIEPTRIFQFSLVFWGISLALMLIGLRSPYWLRCMAWGSAGAVLYGLGSAFIKLMTVMWTNGSGPTHPVFWGSTLGLALSYAVGGWMVQTGYASGPAEIVVGCMTTVDPLVAVLFGLLVLGEGARTGLAPAIGMGIAAAVATLGVVLLSRYHPDAARAFEPASVSPERVGDQ